MYHTILRDASLYEILEHMDLELASAAKERGCVLCGGVLHQANYARKPRGGPESGASLAMRMSFCCAACRKRLTPASVRFLGRRVYWSAVVVLVSALVHGVTPARVARLRKLVGVDRRTLSRWRVWWRSTFSASRFWKSSRSRFAVPVAESSLPVSLLERFGGDARSRLLSVLQFLLPITSSPVDA